MQIRASMLARASVLAALVALAAPALATAQYVDVPRPPAYALQGVTVVQADGSRTENVTVVVRGDFIEAMGRDVAVPGDAKLLEGDSLMIYPGIVDANGRVPFEIPRPEIDRDELEIWNAPREVQGFTPARRVVAYLTADGEDVAAQRKNGIVAAAVHPDGSMMPGRGAVVLYRKGAETPEAMVVRPELGPTFTFRGGPGVYPATLFGVMAFIRQSFENARYRDVVEQAHESDAHGLTMPAYDADYEVLEQVLDGELRPYFQVDGAADILRVIGLADQYEFRPVIVGGEEAWRVADELRRREIPVLVNVDFPEPRRWDPDEEEGVLDAAVEREKREFENRYANAGRLAEAGITIALTSGGSGDVMEGARKAVEHGLSEQAALAALTRTPAALLGIPHVPQLERGLPATFMVTNGPLFDEETKVAYTFVEGRMEEGEKPRAAAAAGDAESAVSFGGTWEMELDAEGQTIRGRMVVVQEGATFTGTLTLEGQEAQIRNGVINGNEIEAVAVLEQGGQSLEIEIKGTVEGDNASGEANAGPMGTARWTATRTPGGAR